MPTSFDDELTIDGEGCLLPAGPLELATDETAVRLDVWVWQKGGACVAIQHDFPDRTRWTTDPDPDDDHEGAGFQPGAATGMGLLVTEIGGQTKTFQWTEGISLVAGGKSDPHPDH